MKRGEMAARLGAFVAEQNGGVATEVRNLRRLAGGASREIWAFEAQLGEGSDARTLDLVMRRDPPGRPSEGPGDLEFRLVRTVYEAGVRVPRPYWCCAADEGLGRFYLMDRLDGEALPRRLLRDERYAKTRAGMIDELAEILAEIHRVDPDQHSLSGLAELATADKSAAQAELDLTAAGLRDIQAEPHPILELAQRWLQARVPDGARRTLVHGDYRVGNVLFDEAGVRAVLDWELAKIGDPVEDLGWICTRAWRFGSDLPAGGLGTREQLLEAYARASGFRVDPAHLLFWEALGTYKVALVFVRQSWVYLAGHYRSLELASLGRRIAEAEEELVRLMEESP